MSDKIRLHENGLVNSAHALWNEHAVPHQSTSDKQTCAFREQEDGQAALSSVIRKLQINSKILTLQKCDGGLQFILALAQHPHLLALNLCLHFQF